MFLYWSDLKIMLFKPKERLVQVGQQGWQDRKDGAQGLGDGKAAGLEGGSES